MALRCKMIGRPSVLFAALCALGLSMAVASGEEGKGPSIESIMKSTHKGKNSLVSQVIAGTASPDDVSKLLADYKIMLELDPPKGDKAEWQKRVEKLIVATTAVQEGKAGAGAKLKSAVSCKSCHEAHKDD